MKKVIYLLVLIIILNIFIVSAKEYNIVIYNSNSNSILGNSTIELSGIDTRTFNQSIINFKLICNGTQRDYIIANNSDLMYNVTDKLYPASTGYGTSNTTILYKQLETIDPYQYYTGCRINQDNITYNNTMNNISNIALFYDDFNRTNAVTIGNSWYSSNMNISNGWVTATTNVGLGSKVIDVEQCNNCNKYEILYRYKRDNGVTGSGLRLQFTGGTNNGITSRWDDAAGHIITNFSVAFNIIKQTAEPTLVYFDSVTRIIAYDDITIGDYSLFSNGTNKTFDTINLKNTNSNSTRLNVSLVANRANNKIDYIMIKRYLSYNPIITISDGFGVGLIHLVGAYNNPAITLTNNQFNDYILYNTSNVSDILFTYINYNGISYLMDETSLNNFTKNITAPTSAGTYQFYFNTTFTYTNGTIGYLLSQNFTQTINTFNVSANCIPSSSMFEALNMTIYDEETFKLNKSVIALTLSIGFKDSSFLYNYSTSFNNTNNFTICFATGTNNYIINDGIIRYETIGYEPNKYYFNNYEIIQNIRNNISLYLLNTSYAVGTTIIIKDKYDDVIKGEYIWIYRYYPADNMQRLVSSGKTGALGSDYFYLRWFDTTYYIKTSSGYSSVAQTISESPITIKIADETFMNQVKGLDAVTTSLYFDNISQWIGTYNDPNSEVKNVCLKVTRFDNFTAYSICDVCSTAVSGILLCTVPTLQANYQATLYAKISPEKALQTETYTGNISTFTQSIGKMGYFLTFMIVIVFSIIGLISAGIVGLFIGLGLAFILSVTLLGLLSVSYSVMILIIIVIIISLILYSQRSRY